MLKFQKSIEAAANEAKALGVRIVQSNGFAIYMVIKNGKSTSFGGDYKAAFAFAKS